MSFLPLVLAVLAAPASALAPGDGVVVHFKDGTELSGVLADLTRESVEVELGGARASWRLDSVERLEARRTDVAEFQRLEREAGADEDKILALASFARARGLHTYYRRLAGQRGLPPEGEPLPCPARNVSSPQAFWASQPSSALPPLPALGFGGTPPQVYNTYPPGNGYYASNGYQVVYGGAVAFIPVGVVVGPQRQITRAEQEAFLREQERRREELRHQVTNPLQLWQFRLQEALDKQARGLPFSSRPF